MDAWIELTEKEYELVWDKFNGEFEFKPSIHKSDWPGIKEPFPSITYSISSIYNIDEKQFEILNNNLMDLFLKYFKKLISEEDWLYALDWNHPGYKFYPHRYFALDEFGEWKVPILPNGDYYIFLDKDFNNGVFGHPWEQSMCIFGKELIQLLEENKPMIFSKYLRKRL